MVNLRRIPEEQKCIVNVATVQNRFKIDGTLFQPFLLKVTKKNISQGWGNTSTHRSTVLLNISSTVKNKDIVFDAVMCV